MQNGTGKITLLHMNNIENLKPKVRLQLVNLQRNKRKKNPNGTMRHIGRS